MTIYTKLSELDIERLASKFGVKATSFSPMKGGSENTNYRISDGSKSYVLTICESKTKEEANQLVHTLNHLNQHGFKTTTCFPTQTLEPFTYHGSKPTLLKSYLHGHVYDSLSINHLRKIGLSLAKLHRIPPPDGVPDAVVYGLQEFRPLATKMQGNPFGAWLEERAQLYEDNVLNCPRCLIHGDVFCDNVIISNEDEPIIMDFEEAAIYFRSFDLGMTIIGCCTTNGHLDLGKARAFLEGYQQSEPITELEKSLMPIFISFAGAAMAMWRYRQFHFIMPDPGMHDHFKELQTLSDQGLALSSADLFL